jgi:hypothetical protein
MAPMAGCIPNANQYGFIFRFGFIEGFFTPGVPVNRVMGMLQQVWTCFLCEFVGMLCHLLKLIGLGIWLIMIL